MAQPLDLGRRISLIDLYDFRMPRRTGTYVLHEENLAIVETGQVRRCRICLLG